MLWLRGEVDVEVVGRYHRQIEDDLPAVVAIDAGEAVFVDSSALALMIRFARLGNGAGGPVILRRSAKVVDRIIELAGVEALFCANTDPRRPRDGL